MELRLSSFIDINYKLHASLIVFNWKQLITFDDPVNTNWRKINKTRQTTRYKGWEWLRRGGGLSPWRTDWAWHAEKQFFSRKAVIYVHLNNRIVRFDTDTSSIHWQCWWNILPSQTAPHLDTHALLLYKRFVCFYATRSISNVSIATLSRLIGGVVMRAQRKWKQSTTSFINNNEWINEADCKCTKWRCANAWSYARKSCLNAVAIIRIMMIIGAPQSHQSENST